VRTLRVAIANDVELYRPWAQDNKAFNAVVVRSTLRPEDVTKLVQATLQKIDPTLPIFQPQPIKRIVETSLGQAHLVTLLLGLFAGIALVLATIGIYGAVAFTVAQRRGEIGVRMALGAQTSDVVRLVVSQGMKPVVAGLAIGSAISLAAGHLLAAQLYQVSPQNPVLLAGTAFVLAFAGLVACIFPAARASFINPAQALRAE
jgi:ABC-type antimicrobial peptide transport system permease subunit